MFNAYYDDADEKNIYSKSYSRRKNYDDYNGCAYDDDYNVSERYSYYSSVVNKNLYDDNNDVDDENEYENEYAGENEYKNEYGNDYENEYVEEEANTDYNYEEDKDYYANDELNNNELEADDDLADYFADARIFSTKKKVAKVKKRPKKQIYKVDEKIIVSMNKEKNLGIILFGPYDVNKKQMYQIELDDGSIIEADDKHIAYQ